MDKKRKILLILITAIIVIILIILLVLFNIKENNNLKNEIISDNNLENEVIEDINEDFSNEEKQSQNISNKLKYVKDRTEYFNIKRVYTKYLSLAADNDAEGLLNMFSKEYCDSNHINSKNVISYTGIKPIENISRDGTYVPEIANMLVVDISDTKQAYFVYGKYILKSTGDIKELNLMIIIDNTTMLYDVYTNSYMQQKGYINLKVGNELKVNEYNIQDRTTNKMSSITITDREMANNYFDSWINNIIYDKNSAYNKLNSEFKNKKYNSLQSFQSYLNNLGYIPRINEYRIHSTQDYTDYICTDQYNNYYIFRQQGGVMRYTVFLDNYTVELDTFKQNYEKADEETKIIINLRKFKQMLNTKDYNAIYNKLNATFKQNNYNNVSKLAQYLKNNAYAVNTITLDNYNQNNDYYVCECSLINQKNTNEQKNMTIIIKLIDSNNFEMSFNIQ